MQKNQRLQPMSPARKSEFTTLLPQRQRNELCVKTRLIFYEAPRLCEGLLGYDHEAGGLELVRMREKEEAVLTQLGLERSGSYYTVEE